MPTLYATTAELLASGLRPADVIAMLADDLNNPPDPNAAGTQAKLTAALRWAGEKTREKLLDRVDFTDDYVATAIKEPNLTMAMFWLYQSRGNYGAANPFSEAYKEAKAELVEIREGRSQIGASATPSSPVHSSTSAVDPIYSKAAYNGGGTDGAYLEDF